MTIEMRHLHYKLAELVKVGKYPQGDIWFDTSDGRQSRVGALYIEHSYGAYNLNQITNTHGGITVLNQRDTGYSMTKRELYMYICGMIRGFNNGN